MTRLCNTCGDPVSRQSGRGQCMSCYQKARKFSAENTAAEGSAQLLAAILRYYEKHHWRTAA